MSSEGDTRGGGAMIAAARVELRPDLTRLRTVADRAGDVGEEFGAAE